MRIITRTLYGAELQTNHLLDKPHVARENTTLNEKFDVQSGVKPSDTQRSALAYFALGIGGHKNENGADGFPFTSPLNHQATDAACYRHAPFALRELDNDFNAIERAKYAMRVIVVIDGVSYAAYYLKRLELENVSTQLLHTTVKNGVETTVPFVPNSGNLNPTPPELPSGSEIVTTGDYVSTTATVPIQFTASDVDEYVRAIRIMFGNENYAIISEIALVAGVDKLVTGPIDQGTVDYVEAIAAQITTFITCHYSIGFSNQGFDFEVELGASEPLLGTDDIPNAFTIN